MLEETSAKHVKRYFKEKRLAAPNMSSKDINETTNENQNQLKLLSSHLSIYNALTNPDLELSPSPKSNNALTRYPSPSSHAPLSPEANNEPKFSIEESWQSITNDLDSKFVETQKFMDHHAILRTLSNSPLFMEQSPGRPSSLLSMTTDEEAQDATDLLAHSSSYFNVTESAMVFETDEETDDDSKQGEQKLDNTLIMPKVSMASDRPYSVERLNIVMLSSSNTDYFTQTSQLMATIKGELKEKVKINHFCVTKEFLTNNNGNLFENSNIIFIINDGSLIFHDYWKYLSEENKINGQEDCKVVIINMMTVNYFINLVDLITDFHPNQMWKTPSLGHGGLLMRLRCFIEGELSGSLYSTSVELCTTTDRSGSIYSSLASLSKPNYKNLEKQFKAELSETSYVDPLDLKKMTFFNGFTTIMKNFASYLKGGDNNYNTVFNRPTLLAVAAFSLGISVGVTCTSICKLVSIFVSNRFLVSKSALISDIKAEEAIVPILNYRDVKDSLKLSFENAMKDIVKEISKSVDQLFITIKSASSLTVDYAKGGFDKLIQFVY